MPSFRCSICEKYVFFGIVIERGIIALIIYLDKRIVLETVVCTYGFGILCLIYKRAVLFEDERVVVLRRFVAAYTQIAEREAADIRFPRKSDDGLPNTEFS